MEIYYYPLNHKWWEVVVDYSNHCQMRWMDRKVPAKTIRTMVRRVINYCFSKKRELKRRIVVRSFRRKCSLVAAMTDYNKEKAKMNILVVTVLHAIMRVTEGEIVIDLLKNGGEEIYENKSKTGEGHLECNLANDKPCN